MMRQSFYRVLILVIAAWAALSIPTLLLPTLMALRSGQPFHAQAILLPMGFALLPISIIGLWNLRLWGFICLVLGFILTIATYPPGIFLHAVCIGITVLRYCFAHREAGTAPPYA